MVETQTESVAVRLVGLVRRVALGGLAGAIAGLLVLGVGGRIVMFISRLLHPEALGRITEGGNRIGEFTIGGTVELLIFAGLLSGLVGGVIWVLIKEWIPKRAVVVGLGGVALGGSFLIDGDNIDFFILEGPLPDLVLLLGLLFLFGVVLYWFDGLLDDRTSDRPGTVGIVVYSLMVAVAAPLIVPTFGNFFSEEFCFCSDPPIWTGVFLVAASLSTVTWWIQHLRGAEAPSQSLSIIGRATLALAALAGSIDLTTEITQIF